MRWIELIEAGLLRPFDWIARNVRGAVLLDVGVGLGLLGAVFVSFGVDVCAFVGQVFWFFGNACLASYHRGRREEKEAGLFLFYWALSVFGLWSWGMRLG